MSLRPGAVVAFSGDLGSGKTALIRGICERFGCGDQVSSPTFTIMNRYDGAALTVYHFDFYRVASLEEIAELGFAEYRDGDGVCLIEWAEKADGLLPGRRYDVRMSLGADASRVHRMVLGEGILLIGAGAGPTGEVKVDNETQVREYQELMGWDPKTGKICIYSWDAFKHADAGTHSEVPDSATAIA